MTTICRNGVEMFEQEFVSTLVIFYSRRLSKRHDKVVSRVDHVIHPGQVLPFGQPTSNNMSDGLEYLGWNSWVRQVRRVFDNQVHTVSEEHNQLLETVCVQPGVITLAFNYLQSF